MSGGSISSGLLAYENIVTRLAQGLNASIENPKPRGGHRLERRGPRGRYSHDLRRLQRDATKGPTGLAGCSRAIVAAGESRRIAETRPFWNEMARVPLTFEFSTWRFP